MPTAALPRALHNADADIAAQVRVRQMCMVFEQTTLASVLATLFAIALAWHIQPSVDERTLTIWLACKVAAVIPRMVHGLLFRRQAEPDLRWMTWGKIMLLIDGLAWGAAGVWLMPSGDVATITVTIASLAGVCAVASFVLHADWTACAAYTVPLLLPGGIHMLARGDVFGLYGGGSILGFLALLLLVARRSERDIVEMLTLRFTNDRLAAQLSAALDIARQENRTQTEFVANMSHELRTPLHGILGLSRMLLRAAPARRDQDSVELIRRCGEHLLGLINNILDFSQVESQGIALRPQEIDLARLVDDTTAMCMPAAVEKRLALSCVLDVPRPCVVRIDPFRLRQILLNLTGNAVKFTDAGSVRVHVAEIAHAGRIVICVEDSGVGVPRTELEHIFEPFVQADSSSTRRFGGTGLGLSITRSICRAMGGDITCTSTPGRGSTFVVTLPVQRLTAGERAGFRTTKPQPLDPAQPLMSGTVVLAEDNDVNAIVAEFALQQFGVAVERVRSGSEAVQRLSDGRERPDLILMDCHMPGMDGFDAARRIREFEQRHGLARVPIVALTANALPQDRDACLRAGMDDYLSKPFNEDELRGVLLCWLAPSARDSTASTISAATPPEAGSRDRAPVAQGRSLPPATPNRRS